jgi:hypothetical protein
MSVTLTFNRELAFFQLGFAICLVLPAMSWPVRLIVADVCYVTSPRSLGNPHPLHRLLGRVFHLTAHL